MNDNDWQRFCVLMASMRAAYPHTRTISEEDWTVTVRKYFRKLRRYELATLEHAFDVAEDTHAFFPSIAELKVHISAALRNQRNNNAAGLLPEHTEATPEEIERGKEQIRKIVRQVAGELERGAQ